MEGERNNIQDLRMLNLLHDEFEPDERSRPCADLMMLNLFVGEKVNCKYKIVSCA